MSSLSKDEGFTLLEVIVSIAILSMSLAILFPIFSGAYQRLTWAAERAAAAEFAEAQLNELIVTRSYVELPIVGEKDLFSWQLEKLMLAGPETEISNANGNALALQLTVIKMDEDQFRPVIFKKTIWVEN